jgi:NADPH:quinone reductase
MKAIRAAQTGGPEVMHLEELPTPKPAEGELLVRVEAAGVNFIDINQRSGVYKVQLPFAVGLEGAGVVEAKGPNVGEFEVGDRVAWCGVPGSYATHAIVPAEKAVAVPAAIDSRTAAAAMLQGLTAHYLTRSTYHLQQGDACLVHAAAGGVGLLLTQMAKIAGARVVGTVSTKEKAELAKANGVDVIVLYTQDDFVLAAKKATEGRGVQVVYDSVGQTTFDDSMRSLAPRGMLVLFGQSSGPVPPVDPQRLHLGGSLFLTRPTLVHYTATRGELLTRARELFVWIETGLVKVRIGAAFPLVEAGDAHRALAARETTGKVLLIP